MVKSLLEQEDTKLTLKEIEDAIQKIVEDDFINQIEDEDWNSLLARLYPLRDFALKIEKFLQKSHQFKLEEEDTSKDKIIKKLEAL